MSGHQARQAGVWLAAMWIVIAASPSVERSCCGSRCRTAPALSITPEVDAVFDGWHVIYDNQAPTLAVVIGAVGLALILAAARPLVERVVLDRSRRSTDTEVKLLAPRLAMAETVASSPDRSRSPSSSPPTTREPPSERRLTRSAPRTLRRTRHRRG